MGATAQDLDRIRAEIQEIGETGTLRRSPEQIEIQRLERTARRLALQEQLSSSPRPRPAGLGQARTMASNRSAAGSTVFLVNSAYDDPDSVPGDGICFDGFYLDAGNAIQECSLRAALDEANATAGTDSVIIRIDILSHARGATSTGGYGYTPSLDLWKIPVNAAASGSRGPLPAITRANVHLDGSWQKEGSGGGAFDDAYCAPPGPDTSIVKVMVDGATLVSAGDGLNVFGGQVSVTGLAVSNFPDHGVEVAKDGAHTRLTCMHIGTDQLGKVAEANGKSGVYSDDSAGPIEIIRSVISGNTANGILAYGDSLHVKYSRIGTDRFGDYAIANGSTGVILVGSNSLVELTQVSGNHRGIMITGSHNLVRGSFVGVNRSVNASIPNVTEGVVVTGDSNRVGGTPTAFSVIAGNGGFGVYLEVGADSNTVANAWVGHNGGIAIPNTWSGVFNYGTNNQIGEVSAAPEPSPDGAFEYGWPTVAKADDLTVYGTVISGNGQFGILTQEPLTVVNTFIGTDATGLSAIPNGLAGIRLDHGTGHQIGGSSPDEKNVISGNVGSGIQLFESGGAVIEGNFIGVNVSGSSALPNTGNGINILAGAGNTTIGGAAAANRNVISGNGLSGIASANAHVSVSQNYIGTDATGTVALPNGGDGVRLESNASAFSSGVLSSLISGNTGHGVHVTGGSGVTHIIWANRIGTDKTGTNPIPNGGSGIYNNSASIVEVGSAGVGFSNTVAFNGAAGVSIVNSGITHVAVNSIFANTLLGIDIGDDGVTPNDDTGPPYDTDTGPNGMQNAPDVLDVTGTGPTQIYLIWELYSAPSTSYRFEVYVSSSPDPSGFGEGQTRACAIIGDTNINGFLHAEFNLDCLPFAPGLWLTMTAANTVTGETSEFSNAFQIPPGPVELASGKIYLEGPFSGGAMSTTLLSSGFVPTVQPYTDPLFDGTLHEYDDVVALSSLPASTVDWVTLSLRTTTAPGDEVTRRVAFVRSDGVLMDYDGGTDVSFPDVTTGSYYLVVCHRNHLCAMSSSAVDFTGGTGTWDFTTALTQAYSGGGAPMKSLSGGVYGLFAADNNVDGQVTAPDFNQWNAETTAGATGYKRGDHNLDGQVTAPDFNLWNANTTAGAASQVPN